MRLAKIGYYGGDFRNDLETDDLDILELVEWEDFNIDYENAEYELNKGKGE